MKHTKASRGHFEALEDAYGFFDSLAESKEEAYDEKSERWQESEAGEKAREEYETLQRVPAFFEGCGLAYFLRRTRTIIIVDKASVRGFICSWWHTANNAKTRTTITHPFSLMRTCIRLRISELQK